MTSGDPDGRPGLSKRGWAQSESAADTIDGQIGSCYILCRGFSPVCSPVKPTFAIPGYNGLPERLPHRTELLSFG